MIRRALTAALVTAALVLTAAVPATAAGSGRLAPSTTAVCGSTSASVPNSCRAPIEWRTSRFGPQSAKAVSIPRRTLFTVFARQGERIMLGSSSVGQKQGTTTGDALVWNPGQIGDQSAAQLPAVRNGDNGFSCLAASAGSSTAGRLTTRSQELAGPRSSANAAGYEPCVYTAPTTGLYHVAFTGSAGMTSDAQSLPAGAQDLDPQGGTFPKDTAASTAVLAYDVTVRATGATTVDLPGRLFTYVLAAFTGANARPVDMDMYLNTLDGYRYGVRTNGFDPNGFVFYGNSRGFLDSDGSPLNRDVVGTGTSPQLLTTTRGSTTLAPPEYPLSFEPLSAETLAALSIPTTPVEPVLNSLTYEGTATGDSSYLGEGGTFTVDTGTAGSYEIVVSRDGKDWDPGTPGNRVLRGVVDAGVHTVRWDGRDNARKALPVGSDYQVRGVLRGGEYHAPMIDVESSVGGGPSITLINPPDDLCPFTGAASTGSNCTTAFYDDRGYVAADGTRVGTSDGRLCSTFVGAVPSPLAARHDTGFDSASTQRAFGTTAANNANAECAAANGTLGDSKGLDIWTYFPSTARASSLSVLAVPAAPTAAPDTARTTVDQAVDVPAATGVLANDTGSRLVVSSSGAASDGDLRIAVDGSWSYVPRAGWSGVERVPYTVSDGAGQAASSTLTITVGPRAVDDATSVVAGGSVSVTTAELLADDAGSGLTVTAVGDPAAGRLVRDGDVVTYTPAPGASGRDSFPYTVTDSSGSTDTARVVVTVTPAASADTVRATAGEPLVVPASDGVLANDSGTRLEPTTTRHPAHGTLELRTDGSLTYVPADGWSGSDSFEYVVVDSTGGRSDPAAVSVLVAPSAQPDALATVVDEAVTLAGPGLLVNDRGTRLVVDTSRTTTPTQGGTVVVDRDGSVTYTPAPGWSGVDAFRYTAVDPEGGASETTVRVTVGPVAAPDAARTTAGTTLTVGASVGVLANDRGSRLVPTLTTAPSAGGSVALRSDGSYDYAPVDARWSGTETFGYTVADPDGRTASGVVTVTVTPVVVGDEVATTAGSPARADASSLLADDRGTGLEVVAVRPGPPVAGAAAPGPLTPGGPGTAGGPAVTTPGGGTVVLSADGRTVTYTPAPGASGDDSFGYTVRDDSGVETAGEVRVTVRPLAADDAAETATGTPVGAAGPGLLGNDLGTDLRVVDHDEPAHGTLELDADGAWRYVPDRGTSGSDAFRYTVRDASGRESSATVRIVVGALAAPDTGRTAADTALVVDAAHGVLANDTGTALRATLDERPAHGRVVLAADGSYRYEPEAGFSGADRFSYRLDDSSGTPRTGVVTIAVTPTAVADRTRTPSGTAVTVAAPGALGNDRGRGLSVVSSTAAAHGDLSVQESGTVAYVPRAGFSGTDVVEYTIRDAAGSEATSTITVVVDPVAVDDARSVRAGERLLLWPTDMLGGDTGSDLTVTSVTPPAHGTLTQEVDGSWRYDPTPGWSGRDAFEYTVTDGEGRSAAATMRIVVGVAAADDRGATTQGVPLVVGAAEGVLANDSGDALASSVLAQPEHGTVQLAVDGSWVYAPAAGFSGTDTWTYRVTDSEGQSADAVVTVVVAPAATAPTDGGPTGERGDGGAGSAPGTGDGGTGTAGGTPASGSVTAGPATVGPVSTGPLATSALAFTGSGPLGGAALAGLVLVLLGLGLVVGRRVLRLRGAVWLEDEAARRRSTWEPPLA